jgi:hypothetical protein
MGRECNTYRMGITCGILVGNVNGGEKRVDLKTDGRVMLQWRDCEL